jgi:Dolichyl-phosphate-mannose-protein mannosyltransferase
MILTQTDATNVPAAGHLGRLDAILATGLATATLIIGLYFAPRGFHDGFVDMGHDGYQARQLLDLSQGGVIFKDTFDQYGPLNGYLNTVGFLALGRRLLSVKFFICGWYSLIVVALYVMARRWLEPALAAFSSLVWLGLAPFYNHGIMISPHAYALCFQALATIIALRAPDLAPRRFAVIGLLAGLCWSVKQSMGAFYLLALLLYLLFRLAIRPRAAGRVAKATTAMAASFFAVIGVALALLWSAGALDDWYLQTIRFPREFYLAGSVRIGAAGPSRPIAALIASLTTFARLQLGQPLYWIVIRGVVLLTAFAMIVRRRPTNDLSLMASITALLWLGAYPSANFMHQWWTASLTIAPFVVCIREQIAQRVRGDRRVTWATVAVVSLIVGSGVVERAKASAYRVRTLTQTISEPPMFRGIRTNEPTKRVFETFYQLMAQYRADHPGTRVVSIESADGWEGGMVEGLPFLTFFEDNSHEHPVYWRLPVLSTTVYPRYGETLWHQVMAERPLLVDHRGGRYKPSHIAGYRVLAAAQSDFGHWYLYAPDKGDAAGALAVYMAADGSTEHGFHSGEEEAEPVLAKRLSTSIEGAWRGRLLPRTRQDGPIELPGDYPFELVDPAAGKVTAPTNVYTWPANLPAATLDYSDLQPVSADVIWRAGRRDIVREFRPGAWFVDGFAQSRFSYLLQWDEEPVADGSYFVARGELFEGGLQIGFLEHGQWAGSVCVTRTGLFEAILQIQKPSRYGLVAANCIQSSWWVRAQRHPVSSILSLLGVAGLRNHFRVSQAGWIQGQSFESANSVSRISNGRD